MASKQQNSIENRVNEAISIALKLQAKNGGLKPSETIYLSKGPCRFPLLFSISGNPNIEKTYQTHYLAKSLQKPIIQQMPFQGSLEESLL